MDRYVGLDAHAESCTLAVMGPTGKRITSRVVETNGHALVDAIHGIPGRIHLCLEEGAQSSWLYEILEPQVAEIVVAVPEESKGSKDDLLDAWARADELRTGAIRTRVYKAPKHLTALRSAACAYRMATQEVVRVKNRLKAVFRSRGILAESDVYLPRSRSKWLQQLPAGHRELAEWLGRELDTLFLCGRRPRSDCSRKQSHIRSLGSWGPHRAWDRFERRNSSRSLLRRTDFGRVGSSGATAGFRS